MRKLLYLTLFHSALASGQCLTTNGSSNITTYSTSNQCGQAINYTPPIFQNSCLTVVSDTFLFTGGSQTYTVPNGVTSVTIQTWGAQGGANWVNNTNFGGYNKADFTVTPGMVLNVFVGGQSMSTVGGYNGGGNGDGAGKGGGGATDVRMNGTALSDRIIVAGGGGGAGYWSGLHVVGGTGGGTNGGDGYREVNDPGGLGATVTGPGASGTCVNFNVTAMAGSLGVGGSPAGSGCGCEGYGGGGGYYGGAGSGNCRGGGGGSGYVSPAGSNILSANGVRHGNGMVVIQYSISAPISVQQTSGLASGQVFPVGTTVNTFLAVSNGDSLYSSFSVIVLDTLSPTLINPSNMLVSTDAGSCFATIVPTPIQVTDNCGISSAINNAPSIFPIGVNTVTWVVTDIHGNSATFNQTITVEDMEAPVFSQVPSPITLFENELLQLGVPSFTDNCSAIVNQISGPENGDLLSPGTYQSVFVVIDNANLTDTTIVSITVNPTPIVSLNMNQTQEVVCINDEAFTLTGGLPLGGSWSGNGIVNDQFDPALAGIGTHIINYEFTNVSGCSGQAMDTIVVSGCASVQENQVLQLVIYPNPASHTLSVSCPESGRLILTDMSGKIVSSKPIETLISSIDVTHLANGMYTIQFIGNSGLILNQKITVKK